MSNIFSGISEPLLLVAVINLLLISILSWKLLKQFRDSLTSVKEKTAGPLHSYRTSLQNLFDGDFETWNILSFIHLLSLHLTVPLLGLGLLLHSDWNFLGLVLALLWSYQLTIRIYPGYEDELEMAQESE